MAPAASLNSGVVVLVLIILLLARRTFLLVQGARYSAGRLFAYAGIYVLLFALFGFTTIYGAIGTWGTPAELLIVPYAAVVTVAAFFSAPHIQRTVRFEQRAGGQWYYRLPWYVPVLSLALFLLRFGAEVVLFGLAAVTSFLLPTSLSTGILIALVVIDLLFGVSVGLLIGRAIGVYRAHRELPAASGGSAPPPLPSG